MATMKSIRVPAYGGPEKLRYEEMPSPQPASGQVLVRVHAASVNPFDFKLASGAFSKFIPMTLPYTPGSDFSGVVEATGEAVYGNCPVGAYAELVSAPSGSIAPKPTKLSHIEAASVPVAGQTAWQGLFDHGRLERGQTVLIHAAAGGVGSFAVQLGALEGRTRAGNRIGIQRRLPQIARRRHRDRLQGHSVRICRERHRPGVRSGGWADAGAIICGPQARRTTGRHLAAPAAGSGRTAQNHGDDDGNAGVHAKPEAVGQPSRCRRHSCRCQQDFPVGRGRNRVAQMLGGHTRGKTVLEVA